MSDSCQRCGHKEHMRMCWMCGIEPCYKRHPSATPLVPQEKEPTQTTAGAAPKPASIGEAYDSSEQELILQAFSFMLASVTRDGGRKRAAGTKPPWWRDQSHEAAIFSHINRRKHGELVDPDSGAHPYVHLAWRALAIAYQETYGMRDPETFWVQQPLPSQEEVG